MMMPSAFVRRHFEIALSLLLLLAADCVLLIGQEPVREPKPAAIHLVGHEDQALLARVQEVIDDWDPRKLINPYVVSMEAVDASARPVIRKTLRRPDLAEFIADVEAAEQLGKAMFWEMQAGSDFGRSRDGVFVGTACASCHFQAGADPRDRHTQRIPYVVWDKYRLHPEHFMEQEPYDPVVSATRVTKPKPRTALSMIVGSQGVERRVFDRLSGPPPAQGVWQSERSRVKTSLIPKEEWLMFFRNHNPDQSPFRQITTRNSPTVINSGFSDRLFHDGRAESTFNGFSIFGDHDKDEIIYRRDRTGTIKPVRIAILKASLASQAVGPVVNEVEMSFEGRTFADLARKLLDQKILAYQQIDPTDPVLGIYASPNQRPTYRDLIRRAFRREWWDGTGTDGRESKVDLLLNANRRPPYAKGSMFEANFSLYWGLANLIYQSELVSNQSPFDAMMMGNPRPVLDRWEKERGRLEPIYLDRAIVQPNASPRPEHRTGSAVFQHGFRVFLNRGCVECHSGPLFSSTSERLLEIDGLFPVASMIHNTLVPLGPTDAIRFHDQKFFQQTIAMIANRIAKRSPDLAKESRQLAHRMEQLRHDAHGDSAKLADLIAIRVPVQGLEAEDRGQIAQWIKTYEATRVEKLGNRNFYTENQRVELAEAMVGPLWVEKMIIPPRQVPFRPLLPWAPPHATPDYAFYDLGFYNLGVSPPRFDRGIGTALYKYLKKEFLAEVMAAMKSDLKADGTPESARLLQELEAMDPADLIKIFRAPAPGLESLEKSELPLDDRLIERFKDKKMIYLEAYAELLQSTQGISGSAYRPKQEDLADFLPEFAPPQDIPLEGLAPPTPPVPLDLSWHRNNLLNDQGNDNRRRSDHHFLSRARALAIDEEPWGLRKPLFHDNEMAFWGSFRTPGLRNIELTGPYMHNGRLMTLSAVIDFYNRGGDVPMHRQLNPDKHPAMVPLGMTPDDRLALEFFMLCLTDEQVRQGRGRFSHPSLQVVNGYLSTDPRPVEQIITIPATGN
ncbi:MAG: cytochrome c peroxidase [Pirellulaceae bacterium]